MDVAVGVDGRADIGVVNQKNSDFSPLGWVVELSKGISEFSQNDNRVLNGDVALSSSSGRVLGSISGS